jgi:hypothetical protein
MTPDSPEETEKVMCAPNNMKKETAMDRTDIFPRKDLLWYKTQHPPNPFP